MSFLEHLFPTATIRFDKGLARDNRRTINHFQTYLNNSAKHIKAMRDGASQIVPELVSANFKALLHDITEETEAITRALKDAQILEAHELHALSKVAKEVKEHHGEDQAGQEALRTIGAEAEQIAKEFKSQLQRLDTLLHNEAGLLSKEKFLDAASLTRELVFSAKRIRTLERTTTRDERAALSAAQRDPQTLTKAIGRLISDDKKESEFLFMEIRDATLMALRMIQMIRRLLSHLDEMEKLGYPSPWKAAWVILLKRRHDQLHEALKDAVNRGRHVLSQAYRDEEQAA